jgi:hypothetical protein
MSDASDMYSNAADCDDVGVWQERWTLELIASGLFSAQATS